MSNKDLARVVLGLSADVNTLKRDMNKAETTVHGSTRKMQQSTERAARGMDRAMTKATSRIGKMGVSAFAGFAKGVLAPLAAIASLSAVIRGASGAMSDFDKIGKQAKAGGLAADTFQELAHAAELGGVATDQFAKAMETFAVNSGQAAVGQGRMITQLKALNPELLEAIQNTRSQEERLKLVADALDKETDASRKAAIAKAAFGEAGVRMVEMLRGGSTALAETARKARDLGIVVDNELIAKAETLNDEFETSKKILGVQFQQVLIELSPFLVSAAQEIADVAKWIKEAADAVKEFQAVMSGTSGPGAGFGGNQSFSELLTPEQINKMRTDLSTARFNNGRTNFYEGFGFGNDGNMQLHVPQHADEDDETPTRNKAAAAAVKQAEAVAKLIENLQHEKALLGLTSLEQDKLNALREAGAAATPEQRAQIEALIDATHAQRDAIEANVKAMESFEDASNRALNTLIDGFLEGANAGEILGSVVSDIGRQLLSMGVSGITGGLSNMLFPGVTAATGGYITGPGTGTSDSIPARLSNGEYVVNAKATARNRQLLEAVNSGKVQGFAAGGMVGQMPRMPSLPAMPRPANDNGGMTISMPITIDAKGADMAAVARIHQSVEQLKAELPGRVKEVVKGRGHKWR